MTGRYRSWIRIVGSRKSGITGTSDPWNCNNLNLGTSIILISDASLLELLAPDPIWLNYEGATTTHHTIRYKITQINKKEKIPVSFTFSLKKVRCPPALWAIQVVSLLIRWMNCFIKGWIGWIDLDPLWNRVLWCEWFYLRDVGLREAKESNKTVLSEMMNPIDC